MSSRQRKPDNLHRVQMFLPAKAVLSELRDYTGITQVEIAAQLCE